MARGGYQQGQSVDIPLTDYAPDLDPTTPGILLNMQNAQPTIKGFQAMPAPVQFGSALVEKPQGAIYAYYSTGTSSLVVGTQSHLWRYVGGTPVQADGGQTFNVLSTITDPVFWDFYQFGDDVIATAPGVKPQVARADSGIFSPLGGDPPIGAQLGCASAGFAFLFRGQYWFCSAAGIDDNWTPNLQTLAATAPLTDFPGAIVAAVPFYRTVIAFKQQAIWVGSFVGPPDSFQWQLISDITGTWGQGCVVVLPDAVAFLGTDDFYITTGTIPQRIPNNLKEWFFKVACNKGCLVRTQGWYDARNAIIYWHFVSQNPNFPGVPDMYVAYNVRARRWAKGMLDTPCVPFPNANVPNLAPIYFDNNNIPFTLTGDPQAMMLQTGFYGTGGRLTQLMRVRAKYNAYPTSQALQTYHTNVLGTPVQPALTVPALGDDDWFNLRQYDRWHQLIHATSGPAEIVGFSYEARLGGIR